MSLFSFCKVFCRQMAAGEKVWSNKSSSGKFAFKPRQFHCSMCLLFIFRIAYFLTSSLGTCMATRCHSSQWPIFSRFLGRICGLSWGLRAPKLFVWGLTRFPSLPLPFLIVFGWRRQAVGSWPPHFDPENHDPENHVFWSRKPCYSH